MTNVNQDSFFDRYPDCIRFRILLGVPFPTIPSPITSTVLWQNQFPASFRVSSTLKQEETETQGFKMTGVVSTYPSLPSILKNEVILDITIPAQGELSRFDSLFGSDIWQFSHTGWQHVVLTELNRVIDLARHNTSPQYMLRNISTFDMEVVNIYEVESGVEQFKSTLFPQVMGASIEVDPAAVEAHLIAPFFLRNYLDARRHYAEHRHHELQVSASNAVESGSWYLWNLASEKWIFTPESSRSYKERYDSVSKAIKTNLEINNGWPKTSVNRIWKRRQLAMHGQEVIMSNDEAVTVLDHLSKVMDYIEHTQTIIRQQPNR